MEMKLHLSFILRMFSVLLMDERTHKQHFEIFLPKKLEVFMWILRNYLKKFLCKTFITMVLSFSSYILIKLLLSVVRRHFKSIIFPRRPFSLQAQWLHENFCNKMYIFTFIIFVMTLFSSSNVDSGDMVDNGRRKSE